MKTKRDCSNEKKGQAKRNAIFENQNLLANLKSNKEVLSRLLQELTRTARLEREKRILQRKLEREKRRTGGKLHGV